MSPVQGQSEPENNSSKTTSAEDTTTTVDSLKPASPTSAPDEDESTITRISECSDDSNLIKLDLSQLVGEPTINSDEGKEVGSIKTEKKEEEEALSGKQRSYNKLNKHCKIFFFASFLMYSSMIEFIFLFQTKFQPQRKRAKQ